MEHLANAAILLLRYVCSFVYEGCVHILYCHNSPLPVLTPLSFISTALTTACHDSPLTVLTPLSFISTALTTACIAHDHNQHKHKHQQTIPNSLNILKIN